MSRVINLSEGMRLGIPFRAQKTISIDKERFDDYSYDFPKNSGITLIKTDDTIGTLDGYYGTAIAEISSLSVSDGGYNFITLTIRQVDIDGELSISRKERGHGSQNADRLNGYNNNLEESTSTVDTINQDF